METNRLQVVAGQSVKGGLTAKQEAFAQGVAQGKTLSEAYRLAYDCQRMKDASIWTEASQLMDNPRLSRGSMRYRRRKRSGYCLITLA